MGIRETISQKPALAGGVGVLLLVGAVAYIVRSVMPSSAYAQGYFTTDDGQSLFTADMDTPTPFDHYGRSAYRAWVFTCDGGKTKFVGYLERYTPKARDRIAQELKEVESGARRGSPSIGPADSEVKKPGADNPWVSRSNYQAAAKITNVQCPDGGQIEMVRP